MKKFENLDVRRELAAQGVFQREVAQALDISENYLSQLLAKPLSDSWRRKILLYALLLGTEKARKRGAE